MNRLLPLVLLLSACSFTLGYPRDEIQRQLGRRFPVEVRRGLVLVRLSDPRLTLLEGPGRLGLQLGLSAIGPLFTASAVLEVEGRPEYRPEDGAFYLREPVVRELRLVEVSSAAAEALRQAGRELRLDQAPPWVQATLRELAAYSAEQVLRTQPVYVLDPRRTPQEARVRQHLRGVRVDGDRLLLEVR